MIYENGAASLPGNVKASPNTHSIEWPVGKKRFLEKTAALMGVSPRRSFSAVIRIFGRDNDFLALGKSVDFSLSGMSFKATHFLQLGQCISVSVSLPRAKGGLSLEGKITRSIVDETDSSRLFGLAFSKLDHEASSRLEEFIVD